MGCLLLRLAGLAGGWVALSPVDSLPWFQLSVKPLSEAAAITYVARKKMLSDVGAAVHPVAASASVLEIRAPIARTLTKAGLCRLQSLSNLWLVSSMSVVRVGSDAAHGCAMEVRILVPLSRGVPHAVVPMTEDLFLALQAWDRDVVPSPLPSVARSVADGGRSVAEAAERRIYQSSSIAYQRVVDDEGSEGHPGVGMGVGRGAGSGAGSGAGAGAGTGGRAVVATGGVAVDDVVNDTVRERVVVTCPDSRLVRTVVTEALAGMESTSLSKEMVSGDMGLSPDLARGMSAVLWWMDQCCATNRSAQFPVRDYFSGISEEEDRAITTRARNAFRAEVVGETPVSAGVRELADGVEIPEDGGWGAVVEPITRPEDGEMVVVLTDDHISQVSVNAVMEMVVRMRLGSPLVVDVSFLRGISIAVSRVVDTETRSAKRRRR